LTIALDGTYTFQRVASGGLDGPLFRAISDEEDNGHTISADLRLEHDTGKAGLWEGGSFLARGEGRAGRSVLERAGSVSAVNIDALFPNVVERFDEDAIAVTELSFSQDLGEAVALYGGLLDTSGGMPTRSRARRSRTSTSSMARCSTRWSRTRRYPTLRSGAGCCSSRASV
jgi:porin